MNLAHPFRLLARQLAPLLQFVPFRPRRRVRKPFRVQLTVTALEGLVVPSGTYTALTNLAPEASVSGYTVGIGTMMLESNGVVMAEGGGVSTTIADTELPTHHWFQLSPDNSGGYINGTFSPAPSMYTPRLYFGSNILPDGRMMVMGGEYTSDPVNGTYINSGEMYDPATNTWSPIPKTPGNFFGDDPTMVLSNGQVLGGNITGNQSYLYNPSINQWTTTGAKLRGDISDEEGWTPLPDGSVLSYDIFASITSNAFHAQRYIPAGNSLPGGGTSSGQWVDASNLSTSNPPSLLSDPDHAYEMGAEVRLPNGNIFVLGANGNTAYYNPSTDLWSAGPSLPTLNGVQLIAADAPAAVLPNGNVLLALSPVTYDQGFFFFSGPTYLYEFNPSTGTYTQQTTGNTSNYSALGTALSTVPSYDTRMLDLPNGHVLISINNSTQVWDYAPDTSTAPAARPTVTSVTGNGGTTYTLHGTNLNGFSTGAAYGDDAEMDTNFPIVKLTDQSSGLVWYAKSFNWTPGLATGDSTDVSTQFTLPPNLPGGTYLVTVAASGISSDPNAYPCITLTYGGPVYGDPNHSLNDAIATAASLGVPVVINGAGPFSTVDYNEDVVGNSGVTIYIQGGTVAFGSLSGSGTIIVNSDSTLVVGDTGHYEEGSVYYGLITGTGGLQQGFTGSTFVLGGLDSLDGPTTVPVGALDVTGSIISIGGVLVDGGTISPENSTALSHTTVTVDSDGGLSLNDLSAATLGGLAGTGDIGLGATSGTAKALSVGLDHDSTEYDGVFMGSGTLAKVGFGTLIISAANADGGTTVTGGTLQVSGSLDITTPAVLLVGPVTTLDGTGTINATVNVEGTIGAGSATQTGALTVGSLTAR